LIHTAFPIEVSPSNTLIHAGCSRTRLFRLWLPTADIPPWGTLTAVVVKNMPRAEFKEYFYSPKWGERFKQEIEDLKIRKSDLL